MKQVDEIRIMIDEARRSLLEQGLTRRKRAEVTERLSKLKTAALYLASFPKETFLKKTLEDKENLIRLHDEYFNRRFPEGTKKQKLEYDKKNDLPKIKEQIKTLKFLLNQ